MTILQKIWYILINNSNVVLVSITFAYLVVTYFILRESRSMRMNQKIPVIVFRFREAKDRSGIPIIEDRMVNIGSGPALDISLKTNGRTFDSKFGNFNEHNTLQSMSEFPIDNVLGVDNGDPQMQICFLVGKGKASILKNPKIVFEVTYKDIFNRPFKTVFKKCKNEFRMIKGRQ